MAEEDYAEYDDVQEEDISGMVGSSQDNSTNAQTASFLNNISQQKKNDNFLHHQLATEDMIDKLEHFYKGDKAGMDEEGNVCWVEEENKDLVTLNEFGVTSLMEIITKYIDKNTILSYYSEKRIYEILSDIGDEMVLFIQCNYEQMGMNTYFKKTKFRLLITTTLHIIESTYRRALHGRTMEEINQSKVIGQFGDTPMPQTPQMKNPGRIAGFFANR